MYFLITNLKNRLADLVFFTHLVVMILRFPSRTEKY